MLVSEYLCSEFFKENILNAGKLLNARKGLEKLKSKKASNSVENTALHEAVTYMDRFTQDFLSLDILAKFPNVQLLAEEESPIKVMQTANKELSSLLIDPIDGTLAFTKGENDFSIILCLIEHGLPSVTVCLYPATETIYVANKDGLFQNSNIFPASFITSEEIRSVSSHYRITQKSYSIYHQNLIGNGVNLNHNLNSFRTNTSGALQVISGKTSAFICPYTAAHDAIGPCHLVQAAGGVVARYKLNDTWKCTDRVPFSFEDIHGYDGEGSPRVRLIAAPNENIISRIEEILFTDT